MSRSAEFGLGATFKQKDAEGNETMRNAVEAVGGRRDGNQARMLPALERPAPVARRAGPLGPKTEEEHEADEMERYWSRSD